MKVITNNVLDAIDTDTDCLIIKGAYSSDDCDAIVRYLGDKLAHKQANERFEGENWYYTVNKKGTHFHSFIFNELASADCLPLQQAFRKLFELYSALGEHVEGEFKDLCQKEHDPSVKTINPLVFWYPAGTGIFDWHQHPPEYQRFQLLMNLTQPGEDYVGGHTHVKLDEGHTEVFDATFAKGDVFSFPYSKWHKVDAVLPATSPLQARISLLMPLHPRKGLSTNYQST